MNRTGEIITAYGTFSGQIIPSGDKESPIVIFLHGFPDDCSVWEHQVNALKDDCEIVNVNLYNHAFQNQISGLSEFINGLGDTRKVSLVAHDMGGPVAYELALCHPHKISKLLLINTLSIQQFIDRWNKPLQWLKSSYMPLLIGPLHRLSEWKRPGKMVRDLAYNLGGLDKQDPLRKENLDAMEGVQRYREVFKNLPAKILNRKEKVSVPTYIMFGTRDPFLNLPDRKELERFFSKYEFKILPAGHWMQRTHFDEVNAWIRKAITDG